MIHFYGVKMEKITPQGAACVVVEDDMSDTDESNSSADYLAVRPCLTGTR